MGKDGRDRMNKMMRDLIKKKTLRKELINPFNAACGSRIREIDEGHADALKQDIVDYG